MRLRKITVFVPVFIFIVLTTVLCSCGKGSARKAVSELSDTFRGNYICEISFRLGGDEEISGNGQITKNGTVVRLDILSPEPYSGMSIEYDTSGLPQSVAVHFSGISTTLPKGAVARLNPLSSIFADDFSSALAAVPNSSITEYEADGIIGLCASTSHGDSEVDIYFSSDGSIPYAMTLTSDGVSTDIVFDSFKAQETIVS